MDVIAHLDQYIVRAHPQAYQHPMEVQKAPESELIRHDKIKLEVDSDFPMRTDDGTPPAYSEEALGSKVSMGGEPIFGGKMKPVLQAPETMEETFMPSCRENSVQQSCQFRKLHEAKTRKVSGYWFKAYKFLELITSRLLK